MRRHADTSFLDGERFDPETQRVIGFAFEIARAALRLETADFATERLAKKIIELGKSGETDPNVLCEWALEQCRLESPIASAPPPAPQTGTEPK